MNTERDQIRIAEAMGYEPVVPLIPGNLRFVKLSGDPCFKFDPFTDANDDYAVLEWCRSHEDAMCHVTLYTPMGAYLIGDFARAALKALESA